MSRVLLAAAGVLLLLGMAACGSSTKRTAGPASTVAPATSSSAASSATTPAVNYGQQYLNDAARVNSDATKAQNATSLTDPAVVAYGKDSVTFARALLAQQWPAKAQADVHTLAAAALKAAEDISGQDLADLLSDVETSGADANVVRADLGLAAAKS